MVITALTARGPETLDTLATHLSAEGKGHGSYFMEKKKAGSPSLPPTINRVKE